MFGVLIRSIFASLISLFGLEVMLGNRRSFVWLGLALLFSLMVTAILTIRLCRPKHGFLKHATFSLFFYAAGLLFFIFIPSRGFQQFFSFFLSIFFGLLIFYIGNFILGHTEKQKTYRHYTLFDLIILVCSFVAYSSLFGVYMLFSWPVWSLIISAFFMSLLLFYYYFWYNKITHERRNLYFLIFGLIILEASWAMVFWPVSFLTRGIVLFTLFYVFSGMLKHHHQNTLSKIIIREYVITSVILLALVLSTARWSY